MNDIRYWISIFDDETLNEEYVHGSSQSLPIGTILQPSDDYLERWGKSFVYRVLEKYRPKDRLPHDQSVFFVSSDDNIDDIYHSGGPRSGFLLTIEPLGKVECHNIAWLDAIAQNPRSRRVKQMAISYWMGIPHPDEPDTWEFVAPSAKVVAVKPYEI